MKTMDIMQFKVNNFTMVLKTIVSFIELSLNYVNVGFFL